MLVINLNCSCMSFCFRHLLKRVFIFFPSEPDFARLITLISFVYFTGVDGTKVCPVAISTVDESINDSIPRLRYLRLDGNEIKPPIPRDVILCFRMLRSIVI